ncbi:MAG: DUF4251 domain-containing protein [Rikenellaceae bacterium]
MKRTTLLLTLLLLCVLSYGVIGKKGESTSPAQEPREIRQQRRAARQAAMEREIDSLVEARAFQFNPQTMTMEPTGRMTILSNPNFELCVVDGMADIFLPVVKGIAPPYRHAIINATISLPNNYTSVRTDNGWHIEFSSSLYSATSYNFVMDVNSKFGTITLLLENPWYNTMSYSGSITRIF